MDIYDSLDNIERHENTVIALGNFDGVHLGHRELVRRTREKAAQVNGTPTVLTFDPHPMKVLQPDCYPPMLLSKEEKIRILSELGIKSLIMLPFTEKVAGLSPGDFVKDILVDKLRINSSVVGYNYTFGCKGAGNAEMLSRLNAEYGISTVVVPPVEINGTEVSSTLVRRLLLEGNVGEAARFLGYYPFVVSRVVTGDRRGRQMGYPTANLDLPEDILIPANGVYAVRVQVNGQVLKGVANIGIKPTFSQNQPKNLEVHCFNFADNIYCIKMKVEFVERIRGEIGFSSVNDLVNQIKTDAEKAKQLLDSQLC